MTSITCRLWKGIVGTGRFRKALITSDISIRRAIRVAKTSTMSRKSTIPTVMRAIAETDYDLYVGHEFVPKGDPLAAMQGCL